MTVQEVVLDLLQYIGVTGFAPLTGSNALNRPGLDTADTNKALAAVNSALGDIQKFGPWSLKQDERAVFFFDPTIVAVNCDANNAQSIVLVSPPSWIPGCSILVDGDSDLNRISDVTGNNVSLLRGYRGPTANGVKATIYADCAVLPSDIEAVVEPVSITPNRKLSRAQDLTEFLRFTSQGPAYWNNWNTLEYGFGPSKVSGVPSLYYTETRKSDRALYLRLNPMPSAKCNVTFQAKLRPLRVTTAALDLSGVGTDPAATFAPIPNSDVENVLLPIARYKFFTHPALKNAESRPAVKEEYEAVMLGLRNGMAYETTVDENRCYYI